MSGKVIVSIIGIQKRGRHLLGYRAYSAAEVTDLRATCAEKEKVTLGIYESLQLLLKGINQCDSTGFSATRLVPHVLDVSDQPGSTMPRVH